MIWRRLLVRSDCSIADLHYVIQVAFNWSDLHLHQFIIHGKHYGISKIGGVYFSSDPRAVRLSEFRLRLNERFLYQYDFGDRWEHQLRVRSFRSTPNGPIPSWWEDNGQRRLRIVAAPMAS